MKLKLFICLWVLFTSEISLATDPLEIEQEKVYKACLAVVLGKTREAIDILGTVSLIRRQPEISKGGLDKDEFAKNNFLDPFAGIITFVLKDGTSPELARAGADALLRSQLPIELKQDFIEFALLNESSTAIEEYRRVVASFESQDPTLATFEAQTRRVLKMEKGRRIFTNFILSSQHGARASLQTQFLYNEMQRAKLSMIEGSSNFDPAEFNEKESKEIANKIESFVNLPLPTMTLKERISFFCFHVLRKIGRR